MQTAYNISQAAALRGMLAYDTEFRHVESKIAKETIEVGLGVVKVVGDDDQVRLPAANKGVLTFDADLVSLNVINLKVNGSAIAPVTFLTDHATTMGLVATAIAAKTTYVSGASVTAARQITVTGVDNVDVLLTDIVVTLGVSQANGSFVQGTKDVLYGLSLLTQVLESGLPGQDVVPAYAAKDVANILRRGTLWVYSETAFNPDSDTLYLRFLANGAGKEPGQFLNSSDSGKALAVTGNFAVKSILSGAGIMQLEINRPV